MQNAEHIPTQNITKSAEYSVTCIICINVPYLPKTELQSMAWTGMPFSWAGAIFMHRLQKLNDVYMYVCMYIYIFIYLFICVLSVFFCLFIRYYNIEYVIYIYYISLSGVQ